MLPLSYLEEFYRALLSSPKVVFLDYDDLPFDDRIDFSTGIGLVALYSSELRRWKRRTRKGEPRLHIFIQHDCDSGPRHTEAICRMEAELGITSTTALFTRRPDEENYPIDYDALITLQNQHGLCFTYHTNAADRADFDTRRTIEVYNSDVQELIDKGFTLRYFSPHGGRRGPKGRINSSYFYPAFCRSRLIWTHNRFGPMVDRYSDGGLQVRLARGDATLDLRAWILGQISLRHRICLLLHPQYYMGQSPRRSEPYFALNPWLAEAWRMHDSGRSADYWAPVRAAAAAL